MHFDSRLDRTNQPFTRSRYSMADRGIGLPGTYLPTPRDWLAAA